jgi:sucrose-6-phosphate hydrolase SacC (GH32 family)
VIRVKAPSLRRWDYGGSIPTSPWRSAQSIPRDLSLKTIDGKVQLIQTPIPELIKLRQGDSCNNQNGLITAGTTVLGTRGKALEIVAEFQVGKASQFGLKVRTVQGKRRSWAMTRWRARSSLIGPNLAKRRLAICFRAGKPLRYQPGTDV